MSTIRGRAGATLGDTLIFLATVSLAAALLYPAWSGRAFRARVASAAADVETLSAAARSTLSFDGGWPSAAAPGQTPPELSGLSARDSIFSRIDYTLAWTSWEVVDSVEAPPDPGPPPADAPSVSTPRLEPVVRAVGAVAVYAGETALLAELVERYAGELSFVLDTMWLLVLPERAAAPTQAP